MLIFRPTRKPAKRLIYLALTRDCELSRGKKVGVDFGCKSMKNRRLFKTQEYYGVDLERAALDKGLALYPDAKAVHAKIEDAELPPADFAICINVFGATNFGDFEFSRRGPSHYRGYRSGRCAFDDFQEKGKPLRHLQACRPSPRFLP